jgi:hypothetical protein
MVAHRSSGATGWTTVVAVPLTAVDAPIKGALWRVTDPAAFPLLTGGLAALFTARRVEGPLPIFRHQVAKANEEAFGRSGHPEDPNQTARDVAFGVQFSGRLRILYQGRCCAMSRGRGPVGSADERAPAKSGSDALDFRVFHEFGRRSSALWWIVALAIPVVFPRRQAAIERASR